LQHKDGCLNSAHGTLMSGVMQPDLAKQVPVQAVSAVRFSFLWAVIVCTFG